MVDLDYKQNLVEIAELNNRKAQLENQIRNEKAGYSSISEEIESHQNMIQRYEVQIDHYKSRSTKYQSERAVIMKGLSETEVVLEQQIQNCLEYSERVDVDKPTVVIEKELRQATARLKEKEGEFGNQEAFSRKLEEKRNAYRTATKEIKEFHELLVYVNRTGRIRRNRFFKFRKFISIRAKRIFALLIKKRGYRGVLTLNHDKEELDLEVCLFYCRLM
jgi:chromosome segregation ATPase